MITLVVKVSIVRKSSQLILIKVLSKVLISTNFSEYEQGESKILVKGRFKNSFSFWQRIGASQSVLHTVANGYKIPFLSTPEPAEFQNNRSATNNYDFVTASIDELFRTKRVVEVPFVPKVVNPLSVSTNKGTKRLILDLRYVNNHLRLPPR